MDANAGDAMVFTRYICRVTFFELLLLLYIVLSCRFIFVLQLGQRSFT
jgi:hypothetical protein